MTRATDAARGRLRAYARAIQLAAATGGLLLLLWALATLPYDGGPVPAGTRRFLVGWCVGVPYWHWFEHVFLLERDAAGRVVAEALRSQRLSQVVWLGGAIALGAFVAGGG
jgi:hypothetical protein